jgi:tetratricopeptide (TPR) repeat protein
MRTAFTSALIIGMIFGANIGPPFAAEPAGQGAQLSIEQMLSIAETQHEIARLLVKEGRYDRVIPEMRKILDLNLQGDYEQPVAKSAGFIAYLLAENRQYLLAHQLLDETLARMQIVDNIASLLKIKAFVYKAEGKIGKAIETLEKAAEIERQQAQP